MEKGTLYGVSTGPGNPELMTVKAVRCLEGVQVIAAPITTNKKCMALDIVRGMMDLSGKEICYLEFAMKKDPETLRTTHETQADRIEEHLSRGRDVAMLNIGDASLYGTFGYIRDLIRARGYSCVTIPGVTSFCAAAAALGQSLTNMSDPMTVIPGSFGNIAEELRRPGTKVIMKSGGALPEVKRTLEEEGLAEKTTMVVNCGLENERIYRDIRESAEDEGYFVTMLVEK